MRITEAGAGRQMMNEKAEDAGNLFFSTACDYYIAGRFAAFARLNPVVGKDQTNDIALNQFDTTIEDLHRYEDIRYPDAILANGTAATIEIVKSNLPTRYAGPSVSEYRINVQEIDELVDAIFFAARRNPAAYLWVSGPAREFLIKDNQASRLTNHLKNAG